MGRASNRLGRGALSALWLLSGCAVGAGLDDEALGPEIDSAPPVFVPEVDAGPVNTPLPPSLSQPDFDAGISVVPIPRPDAGTGAGGELGGGSAGGARRPAADAGTRPATTTRDAGGGGLRPPSTTTGCDALRCTNTCSVAGPFNCCTLLDTCGCTWAPGAYCI